MDDQPGWRERMAEVDATRIPKLDGSGRWPGGSAGFPACCIAGFQTCERWNHSNRPDSPLPCRLRSRRYSRFGNPRYKERRSHLGIRVQPVDFDSRRLEVRVAGDEFGFLFLGQRSGRKADALVRANDWLRNARTMASALQSRWRPARRRCYGWADNSSSPRRDSR